MLSTRGVSDHRLLLRGDVSEFLQGEQDAAYRRAGQVGFGGEFGERRGGVLLVECEQDGEAPFDALDEIPIVRSVI